MYDTDVLGTQTDDVRNTPPIAVAEAGSTDSQHCCHTASYADRSGCWRPGVALDQQASSAGAGSSLILVQKRLRCVRRNYVGVVAIVALAWEMAGSSVGNRLLVLVLCGLVAEPLAQKQRIAQCHVCLGEPGGLSLSRGYETQTRLSFTLHRRLG